MIHSGFFKSCASTARGNRLGLHLKSVWEMCAVCLLIESLWNVQAANLTPLQLAPRPEIRDSDFRITEFASQLYFPYGMARLPDGSLLVATSRPRTSQSGFFASQGELVRLVDADGDGIADGPGTLVATGLPGTLVDLRVIDQLVCVVSAEFGNEQIDFFRLGRGPQFSTSKLGHIRLQFPWVYHQTYGLILRPRPHQPRHYDLFFNVGSLFNRQVSSPLIPTSGLITAQLQGESIYQLHLEDSGDSVSVGELVQVASGVRNAAGLAFHPTTGELWFADNGIDGDANAEAVSADELNLLPPARADNTPWDFGFPNNYVDYVSGNVVGGLGQPPVITFRPLADPGESEGPAQIAWAPAQFPPGLNQGVFIGFHGKYNVTGTDNDENALVYADPSTGKYLHFVRAGSVGIGHLDGLMTTSDSLFVADLTGVGSLQTNNATGRIYQIKAIGRGTDCAGGRPQLQVSSEPNSPGLQLSWIALSVACTLEQATSLGTGAVWTRIETSPERVGDQFLWQVSPAETSRFFRLNCPDCDPEIPR